MALSTTRLDHTRKEWTVKRLDKNREKLHFDLAIQRREVWKNDKRSLWIHSLLYGYPFPNVYAQDEGDGHLWFLDGKQRITTTLAFIDEKFALDKETPAIPISAEMAQEIEEEASQRDIGWGMTESEEADGTVYLEITGLTFKQLPEAFQDTITEAAFTVIMIQGLNDDERDEMFQRLNGGEALKAIELTRVYAGSNNMEFIEQNIANNDFFSKTIKVANASRRRFVDEEIILQTMALMEFNHDVRNPRGIEIGSSSIRQYVVQKKDEGLSEQLKRDMITTTEYLNKAFLETEDYLKKGNVPMIFMLAWKRAIPQGITPSKFGGFIQQFFAPFATNSKLPKNANQLEYTRGISGSTTKADSVSRRLRTLFDEYDESIQNAPEYKLPEPKLVSTGRRGRPRKNVNEEVLSVGDEQSNNVTDDATQRTLERQNSPMFEDENNQHEDEENGSNTVEPETVQ